MFRSPAISPQKTVISVLEKFMKNQKANLTVQNFGYGSPFKLTFARKNLKDNFFPASVLE